MTIIVKRPFEPFEDKNKVNITNEQMHLEHPEFEEKPVTLPITQTSEDVHGGSEVTFSLPDSPNNSSIPNPESPNEQERQNTANDNQGAQERQNQEQENVNGGDESGSNNKHSEDGNGDEPNQGQENDIDDVEESDEDENMDNEQSQSGVYNTKQVIDVTNDNIINAKYYQTEFYRFIELIAEERTRAYDPMGSEEYNIKKLMLRQFEKKPLSSYKMSRVRESVVIILDNSGSMQWWSDNLALLANQAAQRNDVEVFLAPNGYIEERLHLKRQQKKQQVSHDVIMKQLKNRKIIYVGDFDGADTPIELSWYNDVIWVCPESRYVHFQEHGWVSYDESKFKGAFLRVFALGEMFNAFRRLLSNPNLKWYDLCNEHKCGGDEDA
jgi:hypothetical protein